MNTDPEYTYLGNNSGHTHTQKLEKVYLKTDTKQSYLLMHEQKVMTSTDFERKKSNSLDCKPRQINFHV